jgi:PII-like signaling protein
MMFPLEQNMPESDPIRLPIDSRSDLPAPERPRALEEAVLLRIFIGEDDRYKRLPLYEAIVLKAREVHLAGATVLRGFLGFGKSSHMHSENILRLSMDLPMVIEIVDTWEKVNAFLPYLEPMMSGGLVTLERARVIRFKRKGF